MSDLRRSANDYANRSQAIIRIRLRRWLRSTLRDIGKPLPNGNYLGSTIEELSADVQIYGGDSEQLISEYQDYAIKKISKDILGDGYAKDD